MGVTQDYAEAVRWYRKAAEQGFANAQYLLGVCYTKGEGVTQDYAEAVRWYRKAAEQGVADAQYLLGVCYANGEGVTRDYAEAARWYRKAAEQGVVEAQYSLGCCYLREEGVAKNYNEAARWWRMAAEQGHEMAEVMLTALYNIAATETEDETSADETTSTATGTVTGIPKTYAQFFPVYGVLPGKTTVSDIESLGYRVEGGYGSYNVRIKTLAFWDHDGDGVFKDIYMTHTDAMPGKWRELGFDWRLSYDEWLALFQKLDFTIEHQKSPKNVRYDGRNTLSAKFIATAPDQTFTMRLEFDHGNANGEGYSTHSKRSLYNISVSLLNKPSVFPANDVRVTSVYSMPAVRRGFSDFFPVYGVTIGRSTIADVKALDYIVDVNRNKHYARVEQIFVSDHDKDGVFERLSMDHSIPMPEKWEKLGLDWRLSYDEWLVLFQKMGFTVEHLQAPTVVEYSGRNTLSAVFIATAPDRTFTMTLTFNYGEEGYTTQSKATLSSINIQSIKAAYPRTDNVQQSGTTAEDAAEESVGAVTAEEEQSLETARQGDAETEYKVGCNLYDAALEKVDGFLQFFKINRYGLAELDDLDELREIDNDLNSDLSTYLIIEFAKATAFWELAADKGYSEAQYRLGNYWADNWKIGYADYTAATDWWRLAANQGHSEAQYRLGECYYDGKGVAQDHAEAVRWWTKCAEHGDIDAQRRLADCYYNGDGVAQNYYEAARWSRKAAERGYLKEQFILATYYGVAQDYVEAVKWYRKAAEKGYADAQYALGDCYYNGRGVAQDYAEAVKWWSKARIHPGALYNLGNCYEKGIGIEQNSRWAAMYWRDAADRGHVDAQYKYGLWCYSRKRFGTAVVYWRKAAENGHKDAKAALKELLVTDRSTTFLKETKAVYVKDTSAAPKNEAEFVRADQQNEAAAEESAEEGQEKRTEEGKIQQEVLEQQTEAPQTVKEESPATSAETLVENPQSQPHLSPLTGTSSGETYARFFPAHGVLLGKTTISDVEALGYPVDKYKDGRNKTRIDAVDFKDNDGDGIFEEVYIERDGMIPEKWQQLGLNWRLSYNEWVKLFQKMGFTIEEIMSPHTVSKTRLAASSEAIAPDESFKVHLYFWDLDPVAHSDGHSLNSKRTLHSLSIKLLNPPSVYPPNPVKVAPTASTVHRYFSDFFPVYGVTLGKTKAAAMEPLAGVVKNVYGWRYAELNTLYFQDNDEDKVYEYISVGDMMPEKWQQLGLDWRLSYDEWLVLFQKMGFTIEHLEAPTIVECSGRNSLSAEFIATAPDQSFSMCLKFNCGNQHGEGSNTNSRNSLHSIIIVDKEHSDRLYH